MVGRRETKSGLLRLARGGSKLKRVEEATEARESSAVTIRVHPALRSSLDVGSRAAARRSQAAKVRGRGCFRLPSRSKGAGSSFGDFL